MAGHNSPPTELFFQKEKFNQKKEKFGKTKNCLLFAITAAQPSGELR